jgi:hypothetical protein
MSKIEQDLKKFKLQLGPEWQKLHTAKWRRPKWIKFPRSMLEDSRWLRLSPQAKVLWMHTLVIASESDNLELPPPDLLFIRLRSIGDVQNRTSFVTLIYELIQCGFLLKSTPELQSYRVSELQSYRDTNKKDKRDPASEALNGFASPAPPTTQEKRLGEEGRVERPSLLGQPIRSELEERIFGDRSAKARGVMADYSAALDLLRPAKPQANRRCPAFLAVTDYLASLTPELPHPLLKRGRDARFLIEGPIGQRSA